MVEFESLPFSAIDLKGFYFKVCAPLSGSLMNFVLIRIVTAVW